MKKNLGRKERRNTARKQRIEKHYDDSLGQRHRARLERQHGESIV